MRHRDGAHRFADLLVSLGYELAVLDVEEHAVERRATEEPVEVGRGVGNPNGLLIS